MADISSPKLSFLSLRMYVMIFVGASLMCESISALEIFTQKTVSLWLDKTDQSIPCDVRLQEGERISGFSWSRAQEGASDPTEIIKVFRDVVSGSGIESGNFSLSENKSLVLHRPPTIEDEGQYICKVILSGASAGDQNTNSSTIRVLSAPTELYPTILECANADEHAENEDETCVIKLEVGTGINLTCEISGFRPLLDLRWTNATQDEIASYRTLTNNSDGTQNLSVTFEVTSSLERQEFSCNVSGEAVSGQRWSVVAIQGVEANGSPLVVIIVIVVSILLVLLVLFICIILILKSRRRRSKGEPGTPTRQEQLTELERGSVSVLVEEPPVEIVETKCTEGTQTDIPEPPEDEDRMSTDDIEQSQELLNKDDREDSQSNSRAPSHLSSRSDIAHHEFGESWVCVSPEELRNLQDRKDDDGTGADEPGTSVERPQRPGHFRGVFQGFGNLLDTFSNLMRHEA
ncbi:uncharacterized protein LOC100888071 isoform X2 [Strongylocentrotus purpuratus]|uniref:Ig-like domain-containing protein n=1 Tax=Strongylocentrotus purpuratus TaxID=7668 RepID=A0A7M7GHZ5_STRPU|nr:uncharacterized protein LOC100888071 isoform X2 [Strongylocentrotus purpuratus]